MPGSPLAWTAPSVATLRTSKVRPDGNEERAAQYIVGARFGVTNGAVNNRGIAIQQVVHTAVQRYLLINLPRAEQVQQMICTRPGCGRRRIADSIERTHRTDIVPTQTGAPVVSDITSRSHGLPLRQ